MIFLLISTFFAVILAFNSYDIASSKIYYQESALNPKHIPFIIALMGWMLWPIELQFGTFYGLKPEIKITKKS